MNNAMPCGWRVSPFKEFEMLNTGKVHQALAKLIQAAEETGHAFRRS